MAFLHKNVSKSRCQIHSEGGTFSKIETGSMAHHNDKEINN